MPLYHPVIVAAVIMCDRLQIRDGTKQKRIISPNHSRCAVKLKRENTASGPGFTSNFLISGCRLQWPQYAASHCALCSPAHYSSYGLLISLPPLSVCHSVYLYTYRHIYLRLCVSLYWRALEMRCSSLICE